MKKISVEENEIANILNSKRNKSIIDIYKENDFHGLGILIDESLDVYKYEWKISFNKNSNSFNTSNSLYLGTKKIDLKKIEKYLKDDLNIVGNNYRDDLDKEDRSAEIIRLEGCIGEFQNNEYMIK